ncbi:hypothetical protein DENSPDRAFT_847846 [Dentipellis sp. KUC8613]|nr:hypothetical protein DENSPDRAFT_847846 [Dentipellis sp. KUC8613]
MSASLGAAALITFRPSLDSLTCGGAAQHSPRYYDPTGSVIIRVEDTLYRLSDHLMQIRSKVFEHMFSLHPTPDPEGTTDSNPVFLGSTLASEFDALVEFLFYPRVRKQDMKTLCGILHLSSRYLIEDGREYAIEKLQTHPEWNAAHQLGLGVAHQVRDWIEPAFRELVARPIHAITPQEITGIGFPTFYQLVLVKEKISQHRHALAYFDVPFEPGLTCRTRIQCQREWAKVWYGTFAKMLIHPETPKSDATVLKAIDQSAGHIEGGSGALAKEEAMIEEGLGVVLQYKGPFGGHGFAFRGPRGADFARHGTGPPRPAYAEMSTCLPVTHAARRPVLKPRSMPVLPTTDARPARGAMEVPEHELGIMILLL